MTHKIIYDFSYSWQLLHTVLFWLQNVSTILGILEVYNDFLNPETIKNLDCKGSLFHDFISLGCSNSWTRKDYIWTVYLTKVDRKRITIWTESRKTNLGYILRKHLQITGCEKPVGRKKTGRKTHHWRIYEHNVQKKRKNMSAKILRQQRNNLQEFWNELAFFIHSS